MFEISKMIFFIGFLGTILSFGLFFICELRYNATLKKVSMILLPFFIVILLGGIVGAKHFKETSVNQTNDVKQEVMQKELDSKKAADNKAVDSKQTDNKKTDNKANDTPSTNTISNQPYNENMYAKDIAMTFLNTYYNLNAGNVEKQYNEVLKNIGTTHFYGTQLNLFNTFIDRNQTNELIKINKTMLLASGEPITLEDGTYKAFDVYYNVDYKLNGKEVVNENAVLIILQDRFGKYRIINVYSFIKAGPLDENKLISLQKCISNFQEKAFNLSDKYLSIRYCGGFNNLSGKLDELKSITNQECYDQTIKATKEDHQTNTYAGRKIIHISHCEFKWDEGDDSPSLEVEVESELNGVTTGSFAASSSSVYILFKDNSYVVSYGK